MAMTRKAMCRVGLCLVLLWVFLGAAAYAHEQLRQGRERLRIEQDRLRVDQERLQVERQAAGGRKSL